MREDEVAGAGVEAFGIGEEFADSEIGKMAGAGQHALLDNPRIGTDLEHVKIVIGFEDKAIGLAKMDFYEFGHVSEIGTDGDLGAVGTKGEADGVGGVMRDRKRVDVNVADGEALAGLDGFDAAEAFAEGVREDTLKGVHRGFGDIERRFPEAENLGETVAVVGVFVSDENGVEAVNVSLDGGETGESFAFAEACVDEDAGGFGFEQSEIARTAGSKNGDAQADWKYPKSNFARESELTNDGRACRWRQRRRQRCGGKGKVNRGVRTEAGSTNQRDIKTKNQEAGRASRSTQIGISVRDKVRPLRKAAATKAKVVSRRGGSGRA